MFYFSNHKILAIALYFFQISSSLIRIVPLALLYVASLSLFGSGIDIFSGLLLSSLLPVKPGKLTKLERSQFTLSEELKEIIVGLLLGDLNVQKLTINSNVRLRFKQGFVHKDYISHLYDLFKSFCLSAPKSYSQKPDKRTGEIYTQISFNTLSLPCFNYYYDLFYPKGQKIVPDNIADLLTPLGLAYWICDDGKSMASGGLTLCTNSFNNKEVSRLKDVLITRFGLTCTIHTTHLGDQVIHISKKSMDKLRSIVKPHMVPSMLYKIHL